MSDQIHATEIFKMDDFHIRNFGMNTYTVPPVKPSADPVWKTHPDWEGYKFHVKGFILDTTNSTVCFIKECISDVYINHPPKLRHFSGTRRVCDFDKYYNFLFRGIPMDVTSEMFKTIIAEPTLCKTPGCSIYTYDYYCYDCQYRKKREGTITGVTGMRNKPLNLSKRSTDDRDDENDPLSFFNPSYVPKKRGKPRKIDAQDMIPNMDDKTINPETNDMICASSSDVVDIVGIRNINNTLLHME